MMTFEEYFAKQGIIFRNIDTEYIVRDWDFKLAELLDIIGDRDYNFVFLEVDSGECVDVTYRKEESDEEFEKRKLQQYNNYLENLDIRQQREIEEYKRLKLKYEDM